MKASSAFVNAIGWRWMPFVALVAGSLFVVLLAVLLVPDRIGGAPPARLPRPDDDAVRDTQSGTEARYPISRPAPSPAPSPPSPPAVSPPERPIAIAPPAQGTALIDQLCAAFLKCDPNSPTALECKDKNYQEREAALASGCAEQFEAMMRCVAGLASTCSTNIQRGCASQSSALALCRAGAGAPQ